MITKRLHCYKNKNKIIKTYYKNGESATTAFRGDCVGGIVKKLKETGVIANIERPVHHRFAGSAENIAIVS